MKLKWKIFGYLVGFCAIILSILWIFQTFLLTDMYKWIRKGEIQEAIALVEQSIEREDFSEVLQSLELEKEILVMPTKEFERPKEPASMPHQRRQPETITQVKEFTLQNGELRSFTFHAMITPVDATVSVLHTQLTIITGIMILLAILLAVVISRKISKPIEKLNESAKMMAGGNYEIEFSGHGFLEIGELSQTLNVTASELAKVEELRRELMANVSHDMRTPLALIYSYAEMMHDFPQEVTAEQTQVIMEETKRLSTLVDDVLDLSRLETGQMELQKEWFNLTELLEQTMARLQTLLETEGYQLFFEYREPVSVYADAVKISQAFYNLLINAVHYGGADKKVVVKQTLEEHQVTIAVTDYGEGIKEENLPHIWDRYYKGEKHHKRAITGTGIGLSIVKKIIDLHQGTYGVRSKKGEGSTFWFSLKLGKNA